MLQQQAAGHSNLSVLNRSDQRNESRMPTSTFIAADREALPVSRPII
jgi:hypothetical protein